MAESFIAARQTPPGRFYCAVPDQDYLAQSGTGSCVDEEIAEMFAELSHSLSQEDTDRIVGPWFFGRNYRQRICKKPLVVLTREEFLDYRVPTDKAAELYYPDGLEDN